LFVEKLVVDPLDLICSKTISKTN